MIFTICINTFLLYHLFVMHTYIFWIDFININDGESFRIHTGDELALLLIVQFNHKRFKRSERQ